MTKKNNRKGFTIVELVIVIAVIAILATVLVPTISGVVQDAQEAAALQEARTVYTNYVLACIENNDSESKEDLVIKLSSTQHIVVLDGSVQDEIYATADGAAAVIKTNDDTVEPGEGASADYTYWMIDATSDPTNANSATYTAP